jgi:hypothetical protein
MAAVPTQNCNTDLATQKAILDQQVMWRIFFPYPQKE